MKDISCFKGGALPPLSFIATKVQKYGLSTAVTDQIEMHSGISGCLKSTQVTSDAYWNWNGASAATDGGSRVRESASTDKRTY